MTKEQRTSTRVQVSLRIKLRYQQVDTFISKFATNISRGGIFISSRQPKEPGTEIRFELRLADGASVISGVGVVAWVKPYDKENPRALHGMGVRFIDLHENSLELIDRIVEERKSRGLDEHAVPKSEGMPAVPNRRTRRQRRTAPPSIPPLGAPPAAPTPQVPAAAPAPPAPAAAANPKAPPQPVPPSKPAPRAPARPAARPLEPHTPHELGPSVNELIARATPTLKTWSSDELADLIDAELPSMPNTLVRARELAAGGGDLDSELADLVKVREAPVASSVGSASDALAALLGGSPVRPRKHRLKTEPAASPNEAPAEAPEGPITSAAASTDSGATDRGIERDFVETSAPVRPVEENHGPFGAEVEDLDGTDLRMASIADPLPELPLTDSDRLALSSEHEVSSHDPLSAAADEAIDESPTPIISHQGITEILGDGGDGDGTVVQLGPPDSTSMSLGVGDETGTSIQLDMDDIELIDDFDEEIDPPTRVSDTSSMFGLPDDSITPVPDIDSTFSALEDDNIDIDIDDNLELDGPAAEAGATIGEEAEMEEGGEQKKGFLKRIFRGKPPS